MAVSKERFEQGLTYDAYRAQMTRNQERFDATEATVALDAADVAFFAQLPQPLNVLVLAEDWCGDVINNLPVLGRLAAESGKLNLRIFPRDQHPDLMDQYLQNGQFRSIPVFVFFDADFRELGHWIERPARVSQMQAEMRRELFAREPIFADYTSETSFGELSEEARERLRATMSSFREEHRAFSDREVVRELRAIVERGAVQAAEPIPLQHTMTTATNGATATTVTTNGAPKVAITYCAACGYEPQTLALASALMQAFVYDLSSIELIPWNDGAFDVTVNGDLVHSMYREGGFPEHETIIAAVRERMR